MFDERLLEMNKKDKPFYVDPQEINQLAMHFLPTFLADFLGSDKTFTVENWQVGVALNAFMMAEAFVKARDIHEEREGRKQKAT